jgi:D-alanyl-D-alanine carboxypeptidase (penicillin-binding protein 5/6)
MLLRKNIRFFSTIFLIFVILLSNQAENIGFAAENPAVETPTPNSESSDEVSILGGRAFRPGNAVVSDAVYVFEVNEEVAVYSKNADKRIWPASTTKIMTMLLTVELADDLDAFVEIPSTITDEFWQGNPNYLGPALAGIMNWQENLTYRDILYGLMLESGCEAANILAYNLGEGAGEARISDFVAKMNLKAEEIGCKDTSFGNAHGLFSPDNYSTAYDIFLITKYAYDKHERLFSEITGAVEYAMPPNSQEPAGYTITNTNRLMIKPNDFNNNPYYYDFARGIKTGGFDEYHTRIDPSLPWTSPGNRVDHPGVANLVSIASRNEFTYIVVTLGAPWKLISERAVNERGLHYAFLDHRNLYEWAFATFEKTRVMQRTDPMGSVKILDGEKDEVSLYPRMNEDFWALLPRGVDLDGGIIQRKPTLNSTEVSAPVEQGEVLGTIEILLANQSLGRWELITNEAVEKTSSAIARARLESVFAQWWFIPLLILLGVLVVALIILSYIRKHRKIRQERFGRSNRRGKNNKKPPNRRIRR